MNLYKYFGLLAFVFILFGLAFVIIRWPQGKRLTFSQHVAAQKRSIIYYIVLFSIVLPLLLLFFIEWFTPTFHLSVWFNIFIIVSSLAQYTCTLIPEVGGWKSTYHRFLSGLSGALLLLPLAIILGSDFIGIAYKSLVILGFASMLGVIIFLTIKRTTRYEPSYIHQAIYYSAFFIPILVVSYL